MALEDATELRAGRWGATGVCSRHGDGTVRCWGELFALGGALAEWSDQASKGGHNGWTRPTLVADLPRAAALTVGGNHACVLTADRGEVYCWGASEALGERANGGRRPVRVIP